MIIYKLRTRNNYTGNEYDDSLWLNRENAENKLKNLTETRDPMDLPEEWHYWIAEMETSD